LVLAARQRQGAFVIVLRLPNRIKDQHLAVRLLGFPGAPAYALWRCSSNPGGWENSESV
jgi:hypothetical protein